MISFIAWFCCLVVMGITFVPDTEIAVAADGFPKNYPTVRHSVLSNVPQQIPPASIPGICSPYPATGFNAPFRHENGPQNVPGCNGRLPKPIVRPPHKCGPGISRGPESQQGLIPLSLRDQGPVRPIVHNTVGLLGALVAAPFRLLETVVPVSSPPPAGAPQCARPQGGSPFISCQGPGLPPALVAEYRFPPAESQSLLMGILSLPWRIPNDGRFLGDLQTER